MTYPQPMQFHPISQIMNLTPIKRQSLIQLFFTILITIVGFISTMLFSHILGADLMGVYYLFLTYFSIFNLIGDGGFGSAAVKRISEGHEQNEYFSAYITLRALLIIFSTIVLLILSPHFVDIAEYNLIPWIIGALTVAFFAHGILYGVNGLGHVGIINLANGVSELGRVLISVTLVLLGFSFYGMIGGYIAALLISGLLCLKHFTLRPAKFSFRHLKSLFMFGFWVLITSSAGILITYADTIFIGFFMDNADVGIYRIALQFTSISLFLFAAINSTLSPKISYWSYNNQMDKIPPIIARAVTYGMILAVPIAVGGFFLAEDLMYYFYGAEFAAGAAACCILFLYQIVSIVLSIFGNALGSSDHPRQGFYGSLAAVIINVILNIILIPIIGIEGAAVSSLFCVIGNTLVIYHYLKKYMPVYLEKKPLFHIVMSAAVMGGFVFVYTLFVPLSSLVLTLIPVAIGALIYFFMLFKLDRGIRDELAGVVNNFGLKWPKWL